MKKILIIETSAFNGACQGGSFIQADYYGIFLKKNGYETKIFIGDKRKKKTENILDLIRNIRRSDYVIGFGTPLLDVYLQWFCFFLGKKGLFMVDTLIVSENVIGDHYKRKILSPKILFIAIEKLLHNVILMKILPPRLKLRHLISCRYIQKALKDTFIKASEEMIFYPNICMEKEDKIKKSHDNTKNVLFYGTMYRGRGIIDLLRACQILWKKGYGFKLTVLGFPVDKLTLKRFLQVENEGEKEDILLFDKVKSPAKYLRQADVVVLPFRYPCSFQTPLTLLEPMKLGIPVITTDVGSHSEWVKDNETGIICERENPSDIADKIEIILTNKNLARKITNNACNLLVQRYKREDLLLNTLKKII